MRAAILPLALMTAVASCSRCSRAPTPSDTPEMLMPVHPTPVSPSVRFSAAQAQDSFALPRACKHVPPALVARPQGEAIRFALSHNALSDLALAFSLRSDAGTALFAHGIVSVEAHQEARDISWFNQGPTPFFSAAEGKWLALLEAPGEGTLRQVLLAREGGTDERLAAGDQLHAADLACEANLCAALTSHVGRVASPGATLFLGSPHSPASTWSRVEVATDLQGASPFAIASFSRAPEALVVLLQGAKAAGFRVQDRTVRPEATLDAHFGALDAAVLGGKLAVVSLGNKTDERGCSVGEGRIAVEVSGAPPTFVLTPTLPRTAVLRPLSQGALLAWLSPVNCLNADRWIVYAVVLDSQGVPTTSPTAVADASGFALATYGNRALLVLDTPRGILRVTAECGPGTSN